MLKLLIVQTSNRSTFNRGLPFESMQHSHHLISDVSRTIRNFLSSSSRIFLIDVATLASLIRKNYLSVAQNFGSEFIISLDFPNIFWQPYVTLAIILWVFALSEKDFRSLVKRTAQSLILKIPSTDWGCQSLCARLRTSKSEPLQLQSIANFRCSWKFNLEPHVLSCRETLCLTISNSVSKLQINYHKQKSFFIFAT